jgi:hypothetical protein
VEITLNAGHPSVIPKIAFIFTIEVLLPNPGMPGHLRAIMHCGQFPSFEQSLIGEVNQDFSFQDCLITFKIRRDCVSIGPFGKLFLSEDERLRAEECRRLWALVRRLLRVKRERQYVRDAGRNDLLVFQNEPLNNKLTLIDFLPYGMLR